MCAEINCFLYTDTASSSSTESCPSARISPDFVIYGDETPRLPTATFEYSNDIDVNIEPNTFECQVVLFAVW